VSGRATAGRHSLVPYCLVSGVMSLGYGSVYTLLADLRDEFGFTGAQLGLIVAAGFFAGFGAQLGLARLADRGHIALLVRGGAIAATGAMVGAAIGGTFWVFLLARVLLGLGSGAASPAIRRIVIVRDPDQVGQNLGRLSSFELAGFVLGPLIAAAAAEALGIHAPFIVLAVVFAGAFLLTLRLDLGAGRVEKHDRVLRNLLQSRAIVSTLVICVGFYVTIGMFEAVWALLLRDQGAETWLIGLTLSLFTVPMIFLAPIGGRTAQQRGPLRVVTVSLAVAAVCTFSYGVLPSIWLLLAVSVVHACADSFTMPGNQVSIAMASPPAHLSSAQGLLGATGLATAGITGLLAGAAYEASGRFVVCSSTAAVMVVSIATARSLARTRPAAELRLTESST
jgi:MFS family permease